MDCMMKLGTVGLVSGVASTFLFGCGSSTPKPPAPPGPGPTPTPPGPAPPLPDCKHEDIAGVLRYYEDGKPKVGYLIKGDAGVCDDECISAKESSVQFFNRTDADSFPRIFLGQDCPSDGNVKPKTTALNLIGKQISFQVDLAGLSCECMAAVYLVGMPKPSLKCPDYGYCDATNLFCNANCQEYDIMQANSAYFAGTALAAENKGICQKRPPYHTFGEQRSIDTTKPFTVTTTFKADPENSSVIKQIDTDITQVAGSATHRASFSHWNRESSDCKDSTALTDLSEAMSSGGMVLTLMNAGGPTINFNDQGEWCKSGMTCNQMGFTISNMEITSVNSVVQIDMV